VAFLDDPITGARHGLPDRYFDRFVFNMHPADATAPLVLLGHGLYPSTDTADGFAIAVTGTEQRNVRWSTELSTTDARSAGPFRFEVIKPNVSWRLALGPNPTGIQLEVIWVARTPYWAGAVEVGDSTSFQHLFQSGTYTGTLTLDGQPQSVEGWYGQRDRSRGVRTLSGGQGLHLWFQAQFPDRSIGFLLVESRSGQRIILKGAAMHEEGTLDEVVDVRHDLHFDGNLDLDDGRLLVTTASGARYDIGADASANGGYMAGGGYGGQHGTPMGRDHLEFDTYPLDGSVNPRILPTSLTDRIAVFDHAGTPGIGIIEFALSRSPSYRYRPT
jgi:hypothetical protein